MCKHQIEKTIYMLCWKKIGGFESCVNNSSSTLTRPLTSTAAQHSTSAGILRCQRINVHGLILFIKIFQKPSKRHNTQTNAQIHLYTVAL